MKEYDLRKEAKKNAEYITPQPLRRWFAEQIHRKHQDIESVFDPAVGSGQLMQYIKAQLYIGNDVNERALQAFSDNFSHSESYLSNYFENDVNKYEIVVSNYPFSLNAKDLLSDIPCELTQFYPKGKVTGKADWPFIIRSFLKAEKSGYFLCFPGIMYRQQENKFRDFLIKNNYVEKYGLLKNCKFEATNIDLVYLELQKNRTNTSIERFIYDFDE